MRVQVEQSKAIALEWYCADGPLTSCTITVRDPYGTALVSAAAGTVGTATQTISTGALGASTITVSSTTGFTAGQRYLVKTSGGRSQEIRLIDKTSSVLTADQPLRFHVWYRALEDIGQKWGK